MDIIKINIASEFSTTPGARFKQDGPFSGEEFRENFLEPHFKNSNDNSVIEIYLDGVEGYATSFLDEAFGGLARKYGKANCLKRLKFFSEARKIYIEEALKYINRAK
jgi:hypothetical protein